MELSARVNVSSPSAAYFLSCLTLFWGWKPSSEMHTSSQSRHWTRRLNIGFTFIRRDGNLAPNECLHCCVSARRVDWQLFANMLVLTAWYGHHMSWLCVCVLLCSASFLMGKKINYANFSDSYTVPVYWILFLSLSIGSHLQNVRETSKVLNICLVSPPHPPALKKRVYFQTHLSCSEAAVQFSAPTMLSKLTFLEKKS